MAPGLWDSSRGPGLNRELGFAELQRLEGEIDAVRSEVRAVEGRLEKSMADLAERTARLADTVQAAQQMDVERRVKEAEAWGRLTVQVERSTSATQDLTTAVREVAVADARMAGQMEAAAAPKSPQTGMQTAGQWTRDALDMSLKVAAVAGVILAVAKWVVGIEIAIGGN